MGTIPSVERKELLHPWHTFYVAHNESYKKWIGVASRLKIGVASRLKVVAISGAFLLALLFLLGTPPFRPRPAGIPLMASVVILGP